MVQVIDLVKIYGNRTAINGISFEAKKGHILGLLGLNGAGKSTTMNIIAGCLGSTSGKVLIDGLNTEDYTDITKSKIGYLPEIPPIYQDMKVDEYLNFVYELKKVKLPKTKHITEICTLVGINDMRTRLIDNLSKGYKQRVGFAAALIGDPEVIILDEPTVGLDPSQMIEIRNLIKKLGKNKTVILSSHILSEVQAVCDHIVVIDKGRVVADGSTQKLTENLLDKTIYKIAVTGNKETIESALQAVKTLKKFIFIKQDDNDTYIYDLTGGAGLAVRKEIFRSIAKNNCEIVEMYPVTNSLEDVFLNLISTNGGE